jgi:hypothetical protein
MNFNPFRSRAAEALAAAQVEADREYRARPAVQAQQRADELAARADALDAALAAHAAAGLRETKRLASVGKALDRSVANLADAARAADAALGELIAAADGHDQLVEQSRRELLAAGLRAEYADGDVAVDLAIGATPKGVQLPGRTWTRIDPVKVVYRATYGALRSIGHRPAEQLRHQHRVHQLDALLPPLPAPYSPPAQTWRQELAESYRAALGASKPKPGTVDLLDRKRAEHEAQKADRDVRDRYAKTRAEKVAEIGERAVQELEIKHGTPLYAPRTALELEEVS